MERKPVITQAKSTLILTVHETGNEDMGHSNIKHLTRRIKMRDRKRTHRQRTLRRLPAAMLSVLCCHGASANVAHEYTVTINETLSRLFVEARFASPVKRITARSDDARDVLIKATDCDGDDQFAVRSGRLILPTDGISCLKYTVDIERAAKRERLNQSLSPINVVVSPTVWLWRPEFESSADIRVRFRLPPNVNVSVPWQKEDGDTYRVLPSPESADAPAVFGQFEYHELDVPGAVLRVSLLHSEPAMDVQMILSWIEAAATDVTLAYGKFPNPSPQVIVVPVEGSRDTRRGNGQPRSPRAVPFGQVIRDGGESVQLYVNQSMPMQDFLGDWTATHEFSHLMLPYINRKHKWISEGFAQYYQNILLTRSGEYEAVYAWQKLYDGLERGRLSLPDMSPNGAAARGQRGGLMKVYWSGAALALMADVRLRERSNGEQSLDDVLSMFQECCLPAADVWSGPEFLAKLDELLDEDVFMPLYRRYADTAGFPETGSLLERLGVQVKEGKVELRSDAELSAIRSAMTKLEAQTARWRRELVDNRS
jgi:hypothetical protein